MSTRRLSFATRVFLLFGRTQLMWWVTAALCWTAALGADAIGLATADTLGLVGLIAFVAVCLPVTIVLGVRSAGTSQQIAHRDRYVLLLLAPLATLAAFAELVFG